MKRKPKSDTLSEKETRRKVLGQAQRLGCETEIKMLFNKYDTLLRSCKNESERKHIQVLASTDIYRLIGFRGGLTIDGQVVIPDDQA